MWLELELAKAGNNNSTLNQLITDTEHSGSPLRDGQLWFESDVFPQMAGNNSLYVGFNLL